MTLEHAPYTETVVLHAEVADLKAQLRAARSALDLERDRAAELLTTIRSVFLRSLAAGGTADSIANHFAARLDVLARYQRHPGESHDLEMLIREELREFQFGEDARITIVGPILAVEPAQAQSLGLALHELVTNALKFGALSHPDGQLHICWTMTTGELQLDWTETGCTVASGAADHHGFGRALIEQALPDQLDARTRFELRPAGLHCRIGFALDPCRVAMQRFRPTIVHQRTALQ